MQSRIDTDIEDEASEIHGRWYDDACGAAFAMELVGERWSILVVRELMLGGRRFSDIRASLPGISAKVLAERLEKLEAVGIVRRVIASGPVPARLYDLTDWGRGIERVMQELGKWSVQSPLHDPRLPLSPVAFMLSLRTMFDPSKAGDLRLEAGFDIGGTRFLAQVRDGELPVERADTFEGADLVFRAREAGAFLPVFYGKQPFGEHAGTVHVEGEIALVQRFVGCFGLPPKRLDPRAETPSG